MIYKDSDVFVGPGNALWTLGTAPVGGTGSPVSLDGSEWIMGLRPFWYQQADHPPPLTDGLPKILPRCQQQC